MSQCSPSSISFFSRTARHQPIGGDDDCMTNRQDAHPGRFSKISRSLDFSQVNPQRSEEETRLTRSKASLKNVPIEELETRFIPPDITPDMYDHDPDPDFAAFLRETFEQPFTSQESGCGSVREDADADPDYNFQEHEDLADVQDDFRFDKTTRCSILQLL